jgi:hypothetical protein
VVGSNEIRLYDYFEDSAEVNYQLNKNDVRVSGLIEVGDNLEDYFVSLVEGRNDNV